MTESPDNPILIPDPLGRPAIGRSTRAPAAIVLPRGDDRLARGVADTHRLIAALDALREAKLEQQRRNLIDDDFAAGYVTAVEELKALLRRIAPSGRERGATGT